MLGSLVRRADHKSGSGLIADFLQIIQTALPVGGGQCRWMQFAIVGGIICFVPQKITIRPSIKKCLITFSFFFADGECDSTVRKVCFNLLDQRDDFLICKPAIFSALKDKGAKAQFISGTAAVLDICFTQSVATRI